MNKLLLQNSRGSGKAGGGRGYLFDMLPSSLSSVPFHADVEQITRYFAKGFPVHLAIHEISPVRETPEVYTQPHVHMDNDEINIIISTDRLRYKIQLEEEHFVVDNNTSIWIPRGMVHSANVLDGAGYFITVRLN
jgi:mannose-6-phosphate isomerase-like protein (cupin superfamily)